jgi:tryptophanyl-tRNA synthetase
MAYGNVIAAARLTPGGLHLGHYLGSFDSLSFCETFEEYYFVIEDLHPSQNFIDKFNNEDLKIMVAQLKSLYPSIKPVLLSDIYRLGVLDSLVKEYCTDKQLESVHPKRLKIKSGEISLPLSEFLFVFYEVFYLLALDSHSALMNDDNLAFVRFAKKIGAKINKRLNTNSNLTLPSLQTGSISRLKGFDGQRMSKSRNNSIGIFSNKQQLDSELRKVIFGQQGAKFLRLDKNNFFVPGVFDIPDDFVVFEYLEIFVEDGDFLTFKSDFKQGKVSVDILFDEIFKGIRNEFEGKRDKFHQNLAEINFLEDTLKSSKLSALSTIEVVEGKLLDGLR